MTKKKPVKKPPMTRKAELVETANLVLSLQRLGNLQIGNYQVRRALYHSIGMSGCLSDRALAGIREAMDLP